MNDWEKLKETQLPPIEAFFNTLTGEALTPDMYEQAQRVWNQLGLSTMEEFCGIYLTLDVLLLGNHFDKSQKCQVTCPQRIFLVLPISFQQRMCSRIFANYPFENMSWPLKTFSVSWVSPFLRLSSLQESICNSLPNQTFTSGLSRWFAVASALWPTESRAATWNICPPMIPTRKESKHHIWTPTTFVSIVQDCH